MSNKKNTENLQIIKKNVAGADKDYLLKLNRHNNTLELYKRTSNETLNDYHSIRSDFDPSGYVMFELVKSIPCIYGAEDTPTPCGIFNIEYKSKDSYLSGYHKKYDKVKFFGYLVVFEDYFIHSNMYLPDVDEAMMRSGDAKCISVDDSHTAGCIRVKQDELDWLVDNIEVGTIVVL